MALFALAAGLFTLVSAILDWNWFFESQKAKFFVDLFGRNGARLFYGVLGIFIVVLSRCLS